MYSSVWYRAEVLISTTSCGDPRDGVCPSEPSRDLLESSRTFLGVSLP